MKIKTIFFLLYIHFTNGQTVPSFVPNQLKRFTNGSNFTSILLLDHALYVGARNLLLRLDTSNIENYQSNFLSINLAPKSDKKQQCISTYYDEKLCDNYIKYVIHRPSFNDIYACGTYSFSPQLLQLSYDLKLIHSDDGYGYCSLNPMDSSSAIWTETGNPMNIPSIYTASYLDASTKTQPVEPVIYRPDLKRADRTFDYLRTPNFDYDWLNQPHFLKTFDLGDHVLFFFREKSIEQLAEAQDQEYTRVLRVCKGDIGASNRSRQWTSLRKTRLTCVYNNTYLNHLEDIIRISDDTFVGIFSLRLPGQNSVSFLCTFSTNAILDTLNSNNFKEIVDGTQYWSKIMSRKIPQNLPNSCKYQSQELKDDVLSFLKIHCLIGDHIEGTIIHFVDKYAISVGHQRLNVKLVDQGVFPVETLPGNDLEVDVFYLGTDDGKIIKMSSYDSQRVISEWNICHNGIKEIKLNQDEKLFAISDSSVYQIDLRKQCSRYFTCGFCMSDPHCGWNIRTNRCENTNLNSNLINLNSNLCSRLERQESVKSVQAESGSTLVLECNIKDKYLYDLIEWKKDQISIKPVSHHLIFTWNKDLIILNGNASYNGIYNCYADKNELISSYKVDYKQDMKTNIQVTSSGKNCITAENYINQYNNWCDQYNRYHKALNEWEEMKDKSCSSIDKN